MVRPLEEQVENRVESSNIFLPSDGCPGPEVVDLSPQLRLIVINTHWWLHPFDIPAAPDADCNNLSKEEFIESLEETIEESVGRNILIVGHHPITSSGVTTLILNLPLKIGTSFDLLIMERDIFLNACRKSISPKTFISDTYWETFSVLNMQL